MVLKPGGQLSPIELFGPENYEQWESCFRVWRTGCVMLGAITCATLDAYRDQIGGYARRYGQAAWAIVYQTDVRCRLEHLERMRRRARDDPSAATAGPEQRRFTEARPWEYCLRLALADQAFWHRELEEPAHLVACRMAQPAAILGSDALIGNSLGIQYPATLPPAPATGEWFHGGGGGPPKPRKEKLPPGLKTTNRRGWSLCEAFQQGTCTGNNPDNSCPLDPSTMHQCALCLQLHHGACACTNSNNQNGKGYKGGSKKGKGKGKGGKKGGGWQN